MGTVVLVRLYEDSAWDGAEGTGATVPAATACCRLDITGGTVLEKDVGYGH